MAERIIVMGLPLTGRTLPAADLYVGGERHLIAAGVGGLAIGRGVPAVLAAIEHAAGTVCVLASGDPGFFGIVRALAARFGPEGLEVHPAPSSVSLAFARLGLPWDDATVVSAHGRPLGDAARAVVGSAKAAVLVGPEAPPEALGKELLALDATPAEVAVCTRLGLERETITRTDLPGLAARTWDPLSVVIVWRGNPVAPARALAWGRPDALFEHRAGMVTKSEVRAVALGKLDLPATGVLWDIGAGSGSVGIECSLVAPGLRVFAIERRPDDAARIEANAGRLGAAITVVRGEAPGALFDLPNPDRVFIGGGGLSVVQSALGRLRPGGRAAATFAALDRAAAAADVLGHLVQIAASRGDRLPDGGGRRAAENPVFVVWGPEP
ncbi:MAG TPA: precorrin-6y C5,15-methyltransferase (decarboxylating) subunit CbiE [Acidimicrobiales bacterium]|nr:precorrin-6y C5,15-methyltransferase (decarboxylating) subunit CbiE [Acidimicrobiales bacterium]